MEIILIYNSKSGSSNSFTKESIMKSLADNFGDNYKIIVLDARENQLKDHIENVGRDNIKMVLIAGGDGTISSYIELMVNYKLTLGIIPSGTFNNFARDCEIPLNRDEALKVIANNETIEIDAVKVNDKYFVNNSSIGLYVHSVKIRERNQEQYSLNKFSAMLLAMVRVFYFFPMVYIEIKSKEFKSKIKTPFVFIGNNEYEFDLLSLGARKSLNEGKLYVYYSKCKYRFCLIKIGFKALFGALKNEKDFIAESVNEFTIHSKKRKITVAADGEIFKMNTPLHYQIIPKAIKLIVPKK